MTDQKNTLKRYLQVGRECLLWKLDGLNEYDVRRTMTDSGTNLLGVIKHVASVEIEYFTKVFGRACPVDLPWFSQEASPNDDMWATPDESRQFIIDLYKTSWSVSDQTIDELSLDSPGYVEWWHEDRRNTTLQTILVHMIAETHRHAGHVDIVRELIDGVRGWGPSSPNLPSFDSESWSAYRTKVEQAALQYIESR